MIPNLLVYLPNTIEKIQGLESFYAAIILKASIIALSLVIMVPLLPNAKLVTLTLFTNVYRPYGVMKEKMKLLKAELDSVKDFREASEQEIEDYEDVRNSHNAIILDLFKGNTRIFFSTYFRFALFVSHQ